MYILPAHCITMSASFIERRYCC